MATCGPQTPRHAHTVVDELGLQEARVSDFQVGPEDRPDMDATKKSMIAREARHYRRCTARLNYMAKDRPDPCATEAWPSQRRGDEKPADQTGTLCPLTWLCALIVSGQAADERGVAPVAWQFFWAKISLTFARRVHRDKTILEHMSLARVSLLDVCS